MAKMLTAALQAVGWITIVGLKWVHERHNQSLLCMHLISLGFSLA